MQQKIQSFLPTRIDYILKLYFTFQIYLQPQTDLKLGSEPIRQWSETISKITMPD